MSMVPPARSTRGGAEDSMIMDIRSLYFVLCALSLVRLPTDPGPLTRHKVPRTKYKAQRLSISLPFSLRHPLLLLAAMWLERDVFLKLLAYIVQFFRYCVLQLLQPFRICFFHFR